MPELPEVETVVKLLSKNFKLKEIKKIELINDYLLKSHFKNTSLLSGQIIRNIERKGKYIFFILDDYVLIFHLRMTGKFLLESSFNFREYGKSLALIVHFEDDYKLFFCDVRNFATLHIQSLIDYKNSYPYNSIGLDLLNDNIDELEFYNFFNKRAMYIKSALLDQKIMSGIGNIYASEILFHTQVNPYTLTNSISEKKYREIIDFAKVIINKSVKMGGCSIS
ncbi:MAG TPA: DNA-formamidopyrimidine glycosylase family protein, partial [Mycoplasmatales bacterium]|nr:DNA-formamidopyrimidine glycosylase family protein [Mycoplasmatales bacterium]